MGSKPRWIFLVVAVPVAAAFLPALWNEFLTWDDRSNFILNPEYRGLTPSRLGWMWTTTHMGHWHPLTWMTLGMDYLLWGMKPGGYHFTSLLFHAASASVLFFVLRRLLGRVFPGWKDEPGDPVRTAALLGALFWGLHPLRVESVAWVSERRDVVCGLFFLLSVAAYVRMVDERESGGRWGRWLAASAAAFGASLLSKSLGIMLPFVLLLMDAAVFRRFKPGARLPVLLEKAPFLVLAVLVGLKTVSAMTDIGQVRPAEGNLSLDRVAQACYGLCFYLWKTLLPFNLSPLYPIEQGVDPSEARFVAALVAAPAITLGLVVLAKRCPAAVAAWVGFGLLVAPVLGGVVRGPQLAADRYTYLSSLPFSALLAAGIGGALRGSRRAWVVPSMAAVFLAMAALTAAQTRVWRDTLSLWTHAIDSGWGGSVAYVNRASERVSRQDLEGAKADLEAALRINETYALAWLNRGKMREMEGDKPGALEDYARAIAHKIKGPDAHERRAGLREAAGDRAGALSDLAEAVRLFPASAAPRLARGKLRLRMGDTKAALEDFDEGLRLNPRDAVGLYERGYARAVLGDAAGALRDFDACIAIDPATAGVYLNRGAMRAGRGEFPSAIADFSEEIRRNPSSFEAYRQRGMAKQLSGDPRGAASDFEQVLRLAPAGWPGRRELEARLSSLRR